MILDLLIGSSTDLYAELLNNKLINKSFETEYFFGRGYSALLFQGMSENPEKVRDILKEELLKMQENGIDRKVFEGIKKDYIGKCLTDWDNPEDIVSVLVDSVFTPDGPFGEMQAVRAITAEDVEEKIKEINLENISLSVINPVE